MACVWGSHLFWFKPSTFIFYDCVCHIRVNFSVCGHDAPLPQTPKQNIYVGLIDMGGKHIAFGHRPYELKQDCAWADIMISKARLPRDFFGERKVKVLRYYEFKRSSAVSINLADDVEIRTVSDQHGQRPWTNQNKKGANILPPSQKYSELN